MLPTCRKFPEDFGKERPCLNYHIHQCMGVCSGKISREAYHEALDEALQFIRTGGMQSVEKLTERMQEAAETLDFERAARYRDRISAIRRITEQQKVIEFPHESLDVLGWVQGRIRSIARCWCCGRAACGIRRTFPLTAWANRRKW